MQGGSGQLTHTARLWLAALLLVACTLPANADPVLQRETMLIWQGKADWFGGFSGIEVRDQGETLHLITDKGRLINARMQREEGRLVAITNTNWRKIRYTNGIGVKGPFTDSEGLAIAPDGRIFVTFENRHRLAEVDPATGVMTQMPGHPDFRTFAKNSGLEALAIHPDGRLFALPERSGSRRTPFNMYTFGGNTWQITGQLARHGPFLPVGADFDANGMLYLLERAATPLGFRSRIRRFDPDQTTRGVITLLTTGPAQYDNLEGISVWTDAAGQTRLTLISDDNFLSIQRTQVVEYLLTE